PMTSSASRLLAGRQSEYEKLESQLRELYGRETLLFNSGYHANTGAVSALAQADRTLIVADKLVHASIIDGMTLSHAPFTRFRHNDMAHLERILAKESASYNRLMVVVESVYSMDGDRAPLDELVRLKRQYPKTMLYVDEAHALGVEGDRGLGLCRNIDGYEEIDVIIGTFGKACASMGAFAAVSDEIYHYLVNRARSLIFSTALPPITVAWTSFMMDKIVEMNRERTHLKSLGEQLAAILRPLVSVPAQITPSHIQPFVTGDPVKAVSLSQALLTEGFKVLPIRRPTVPPGTDRLRISLSASLTHKDIERFGEVLKRMTI
ncbi:MAG: 8-amino-7-oxononanoate synthase, partial [Duncaniella sp.]|nr:8-amino-7-oxononanoate synthase [Duncaniella sp.]